MTPQEDEYLIRVLSAVNDMRKVMLQRMRELEAVVEGLLNRPRQEQECKDAHPPADGR